MKRCMRKRAHATSDQVIGRLRQSYHRLYDHDVDVEAAYADLERRSREYVTPGVSFFSRFTAVASQAWRALVRHRWGVAATAALALASVAVIVISVLAEPLAIQAAAAPPVIKTPNYSTRAGSPTPERSFRLFPNKEMKKRNQDHALIVENLPSTEDGGARMQTSAVPREVPNVAGANSLAIGIAIGNQPDSVLGLNVRLGNAVSDIPGKPSIPPNTGTRISISANVASGILGQVGAPVGASVGLDLSVP
jgi:hypothetical protein